ncbi:MAG: tetratricopeptide repeat protein [Magnetococcales bacterium]|nr:tetratricopeptide repeat protein [Magnetococcales bacterium]
MNRALRRKQQKLAKKNSKSKAVHNSRDAEAQRLLDKGVALHKSGDLAQAIEWYEKVLVINPRHTMALSNIGLVAKDQGKLDYAVSCYKKALSINPKLSGVYNNLGLAQKEQGEHSQAVASYQKAIAIEPELGVAYNNLGLALTEEGRYEEAASCYHKLIELQPNFAEAYNNLGLTLKEQFKPDEAEAYFKKALSLKPTFVGAYNNLGQVLKDQGKLQEAITSFQQALLINPRYAKAHSNLLFTISYYAMWDESETLKQHMQWDKIHGQLGGQNLYQHKADNDKDKILNIGYVSADFKRHPVAVFLQHILQSHDKKRFKIFCYSGVVSPDRITAKFKSSADVWHEVFGWGEKKLAQQIFNDKIDILIDLTGHTANNRLKAFTFKPSPIQATYLGYCNTTGLQAMDYWLTDSVLTPDNSSDKSVETTVPLPGCWVCYQPENRVDVALIKREPDSGVVFGSFNQISKLNDDVVKLWSDILSQVASSKLLLKSKYLNSSNAQKAVIKQFAQYAIDPSRLILQQSTKDYMQQYGLVDIALDPFPRTGGATTCDALWMGVPVITLAGKRVIQRQGASILTAIGKTDWIATNKEEYVNKAVELAQQGVRSGEKRVELHNIVASSDLCDSAKFITNLEVTYRKMWHSHIAMD